MPASVAVLGTGGADVEVGRQAPVGAEDLAGLGVVGQEVDDVDRDVLGACCRGSTEKYIDARAHWPFGSPG